MKINTFIILIFFSYNLLGSEKVDSIPLLSYQDSVFLNIDEYPLKTFYHKVEKGQTMYALSKYYGLKVQEILYFNPHLNQETLSIGDSINIPLPSRMIKRYKNRRFKNKEHVPIFYVVKKGDNLYKISKRFFKMPVERVMKRNGLTEPIISENQKLHIGWMHVGGIPDSVQYRGGLSYYNMQLRYEYYESFDSSQLVTQNGPAYWQVNTDNSREFLVLHDHAPINSVVSIEHPLTNRIAYAKVMGRIPEVYHGSKIVLSGATAQYLGAKDKKIYCIVHYMKP